MRCPCVLERAHTTLRGSYVQLERTIRGFDSSNLWPRDLLSALEDGDRLGTASDRLWALSDQLWPLQANEDPLKPCRIGQDKVEAGPLS